MNSVSPTPSAPVSRVLRSMLVLGSVLLASACTQPQDNASTEATEATPRAYATADAASAPADNDELQAGSASGSEAKTEAAADERTYILKVEGMSCATNCAPKVKESLASIDGVRSVEVDFENKTATVRTAPDKDLTTEECDKSFDNAGYFVDEITLQEGNDGEDTEGEAPASPAES